MVILALDISTKSTGIAVFKDEQLIHYQCASGASTNVFNRIQKITKQIQQNVVQRFSPDVVVIELPLPADVEHNMATYRKLTFAHGIIGLMLNKYKLKYDAEYTSSEWRSAVEIKTGAGIKRNPLKAKDIQKVKELYNITVNDDIADAILIGLAYIKKSKTEINFE